MSTWIILAVGLVLITAIGVWRWRNWARRFRLWFLLMVVAFAVNGLSLVLHVSWLWIASMVVFCMVMVYRPSPTGDWPDTNEDSGTR